MTYEEYQAFKTFEWCLKFWFGNKQKKEDENAEDHSMQEL